MRKLLGAVLIALLTPAALAAQGPPIAGETRMAPKKIPRMITSDVASNTAIARVRTDLAAGKLNAWGSGNGGSIRAEPQQGGGGGGGKLALTAAGVVFKPAPGTDPNLPPVYVVGVTAPNATGHVRVIVNASTGAVIGGATHASFSWGAAPEYWKQGLNSPPPAKSN